MGLCACCGKPAGFPRSSHRRCRDARRRAVAAIENLAAGAAGPGADPDALGAEIADAAARGLYYRVGGFRGERVQTTETTHVDTGLLAATTKHLYFSGPHKGFRVRYDRIVAFKPYRDGIGVQREVATAKPRKFITGDGWFIYNLVTNLARL